MDNEIKAGVTVMAKFVDASNDKFGGYINYIDREEAVRNKNIDKFNTYMDYMGNPQKTSALFTKDLDCLNKEQVEKLKNDFSLAQKNESLMWQTVISFDNRWLAENGLYDEKTKTLDSGKIMEMTRGCMKNILKKEEMEKTAFWSASIHYNTDNIHVHIATSEIQCSRRKQKKSKMKFSNAWCRRNGVLVGDNKIDKDKLKQLCEENGFPKGRWFGMYVDNTGCVQSSLCTDEELTDKVKSLPFVNVYDERTSYLGKWKLGSIEAGKSYVVNQSYAQKETNLMINNIIRGSILEGKKKIPIGEDKELRGLFFEIYNNLPSDKRQWNYASNTLGSARREKIDELSKAFLDRYFLPEMEELNKLMQKQEEDYRKAYGTGTKIENHFAENKMKDLYKRLGNSILKEMRDYDRRVKQESRTTSTSSSRANMGNRENVNIISHRRQGTKGSRTRRNQGELDRSLRMLKRALEKDIQNFRNQAVFRQLEQEIEYENHKERGIAE